jgi:hypothetical protein
LAAGCSRRVGGVVVAGSMEWRLASVSLLCLGLLVRCGAFLLPQRRLVRHPPPPPVHGRPQQRRTGDDVTHSSPPSRLHSLSSLAAVFTRMGKTLKRVGRRRQLPRGLPIGSRSRWCRGKEGRRRSYWWPWRGGRRCSTQVVPRAPLASPGEGKGVNSPSGIP